MALNPQVMDERDLFLKLLERSLKTFYKGRRDCVQAQGHVRDQVWNLDWHMKEQFKMLHGFLNHTEKAMAAELTRDEQEKLRVLAAKLDGLDGGISTLLNTIKGTKKDRRVSRSVVALREHKARAEPELRALPDPRLDRGALIDEVHYRGNLVFRVWGKMKEVVTYTPVLLDPSTAHPICNLTGDLTGMTRLDNENKFEPLPDNAERFDYWYLVLASEGFSSGFHRWDVEVGNNERWQVGVLEECFRRKGGSAGNFWRIMYADGEFNARCSPGRYQDLAVSSKPWRIRVLLDWSQGKLSFFDPDANTHIHTFRHTFTDTLIPFVYNRTEEPLKISPRDVSVVTEGDGIARLEGCGEGTAVPQARTERGCLAASPQPGHGTQTEPVLEELTSGEVVRVEENQTLEGFEVNDAGNGKNFRQDPGLTVGVAPSGDLCGATQPSQDMHTLPLTEELSCKGGIAGERHELINSLKKNSTKKGVVQRTLFRTRTKERRAASEEVPDLAKGTSASQSIGGAHQDSQDKQMLLVTEVPLGKKEERKPHGASSKERTAASEEVPELVKGTSASQSIGGAHQDTQTLLVTEVPLGKRGDERKLHGAGSKERTTSSRTSASRDLRGASRGNQERPAQFFCEGGVHGEEKSGADAADGMTVAQADPGITLGVAASQDVCGASQPSQDLCGASQPSQDLCGASQPSQDLCGASQPSQDMHTLPLTEELSCKVGIAGEQHELINSLKNSTKKGVVQRTLFRTRTKERTAASEEVPDLAKGTSASQSIGGEHQDTQPLLVTEVPLGKRGERKPHGAGSKERTTASKEVPDRAKGASASQSLGGEHQDSQDTQTLLVTEVPLGKRGEERKPHGASSKERTTASGASASRDLRGASRGNQERPGEFFCEGGVHGEEKSGAEAADGMTVAQADPGITLGVAASQDVCGASQPSQDMHTLPLTKELSCKGLIAGERHELINSVKDSTKKVVKRTSFRTRTK